MSDVREFLIECPEILVIPVLARDLFSGEVVRDAKGEAIVVSTETEICGRQVATANGTCPRCGGTSWVAAGNQYTPPTKQPQKED